MDDICSRELCTGCYACYNVCPVSCISMQAFDNGHLFPVIDNDQCTTCGLCRKTCPANAPVCLRLPLKTFAAYSKKAEERKESTSGAVASLLSSYVVKNGGVVYGCAVSSGLCVEHIRVDTSDQLYRLKGSKYVQSEIGDIYRQIKTDLKNRRNVLFIGTPCQVAGLNRYIKDRSGLLTADLICHGVPSQALFRKHVNEILEGKEVDSISFRNEKGYCLTLSCRNEVLYEATLRKDLYLIGFLKSLFFRQSCYNCPYATSKRGSDFTLGDFWGLGQLEQISFPEDRKVSVVLVNSQNGLDVLNACSDNLCLEERPYAEALKGNLHLRVPVKKNNKYKEFASRIEHGRFEDVARACLWFHLIKNRILLMLGK